MPTLTHHEFEQHILNWRLQELNTVIDEVENVFADRVHKKETIAVNYKNILYPSMGKCITSFREIICLVMFGYPDGALSLSRNLYEQFITIFFLENHRQDDDFDDIIKDYFYNYRIQQYKALKYEAMHCVQNSKLVSFYESKIRQIKKVAHHKIIGDYWWTGKDNFGTIVKDIQNNTAEPFIKSELAYLHLIYKRACASIHANCFGNNVRLGVDSKYRGVDTSPQSNGHGVALYLSIFSFLIVAGTAFTEFDLEFDAYEEKIKELIVYYKKIVWEA